MRCLGQRLIPSPFPFSLFQSHPSVLTQLKQMKELEQEKDSLLAGLEVVERARDWYQGQIHNVTERQRQVGQNSQCTVGTERRLARLAQHALSIHAPPC